MKIGMGIAGRTIAEIVEQARRVVADGFTSTWTANIFDLDAMMQELRATHSG